MILLKSEAKKASKTDTNFKRLTSVQCNYTSSFKPVGRAHQGPRRGASPIRLRRRERRAAVREAIDIGDTTEEAVNVNETIPEPVRETEPVENAADTEKSANASRAAEISIYTLA